MADDSWKLFFNLFNILVFLKSCFLFIDFREIEERRERERNLDIRSCSNQMSYPAKISLFLYVKLG